LQSLLPCLGFMRMPRRKIRQSVALTYDASLPAPLVIAKGKGLMAERIDSLARASGVPLVRNEELASGLAPVDVGEFVPLEYWELMARILVFIRKARL